MNVTEKVFVLSKLRNVGPRTIQKLTSVGGIAERSIMEIAALDARAFRAASEPGALEQAELAAERDMAAAAAAGASILFLREARYPSLLRVTPDAPVFLYVLGSLDAVSHRDSIAVIGTRSPTRHGALVAARIAGYFAERRWSVVSGLALGVDAASHRAAVDAGGQTVGVLAHGLQTIAPKQNEKLARQIVEASGALVTEYAFGTAPQPAQFVKRDRIQAGLGRGVIMVQSDRGGGSLHAAKAALGYGRILAVPAPTNEDVAAAEKKIEANSLLCGENAVEKIELLGCSQPDLQNLVVLRSRDDYACLVERLRAAGMDAPAESFSWPPLPV
jgi:DNA processing protein